MTTVLPALLSLLLPLSPARAAPCDEPTLRPLGEALLADLGCLACHPASAAATARLVPDVAPRLDGIASRARPEWIREYLILTSEAKPEGRMPAMLDALPQGRREEVAEDLTHFLMTLGEPLPRGPRSVSPHVLERGRLAYHEVGCAACHAPEESLAALDWSWVDALEAGTPAALDGDADPVVVSMGTLPPSAAPLGPLEWKTDVDALAAFLADPLAVRPGGRMPSSNLEPDEAFAIAAYLLREQALDGERALEPAPGLAYEYYEERFEAARPDFDAFTPKRRGAASGFTIEGRDRDDHFGFRFTGFVELPREGEYTFGVTSDDGSQMWVDGEHVDNGGTHPMTEKALSLWRGAGRYPIVVTMYEVQGGQGLEVRWEGPGIEKGEIPAEALSHLSLVYENPYGREPFTADPARVEVGRVHFRQLGCVHCHSTGTALDQEPRDRARPLGALDPDAATGCLVPERQAGVPRFHQLGGSDLALLRDTLRSAGALDEPLEPARAVAHAFERLNCYACHRRDEIGGVHPLRRGYFLADEDAELGDEGKIPPDLTGVGAKLREHALRAVLVERENVRPYMATRMPHFGPENVEPLVALLRAADLAAEPPADAPPRPEAIEAGRLLAGTEGGLGCIQCHTFAGHRSLGVQAVDLTAMQPRLQRPWFETLLRDPPAVNMNTRMPILWTDGASPAAAFGGDVERQIEALWAYLSMGTAMGYPPGLVPPAGTYDLVPSERPITVGVFMKDVSPRVVCVGFPERVHYAFDVQGSLLAKVWRGDFLNVEGTWHGRAGALEVPAGVDVLDLAQEHPLTVLDEQGRALDPERRALGRRFDPQGRPTFRYALNGLTVEETLVPAYLASGVGFQRAFRISAPAGFAGEVLIRESAGSAARPVALARPRGAPRDARLAGRARTEVSW